jgi:membrane-associated phospholipid phosphatase
MSVFQAIRSVDVSVFHFLNGYAGNWLLDRFASFEENNNLFKGGLFLAMYVYLWFRIGPDEERRRKTIIAILIGTLLTLVVSRAIADLAPFRIRPMSDPSISSHPYSFPTSPNMENWSSFPSDTAAYFSALAFGLAYLLRRYTLPIMLYTAGWICLPRAFLGLHYASDMVVGSAVGITVVWASVRSEWLRSSLAPRVLDFMEAKPEIFYASAFLLCFEMGVLFDDVRRVGRSLFHISFSEPYHELFRSLISVCVFLVLVMIAAYVMFWVLNRFRRKVNHVSKI